MSKTFQVSLAPDKLWQAINPWTFYQQDAQLGFINIELGQTPRPEIEQAILDIGLPDGSALDLLPLLGTGRAQPIPVVLFTASDAPNEITTRVDSVLIKSKTWEDKLVETIRQLIG